MGKLGVTCTYHFVPLPQDCVKRDIGSLQKQEDGGCLVMSVLFSSCLVKAKAVVSALELWTVRCLVPGHQIWLEEEETQ